MYVGYREYCAGRVLCWVDYGEYCVGRTQRVQCMPDTENTVQVGYCVGLIM